MLEPNVNYDGFYSLRVLMKSGVSQNFRVAGSTGEEMYFAYRNKDAAQDSRLPENEFEFYSWIDGAMYLCYIDMDQVAGVYVQVINDE